MSASRRKSSSAARRSSPQAKRGDALSLLRDDHKRVDDLFKKFEKLDEDDEGKAELVEQICNELTVHAQIEEEVFYPAVREAIGDDDLMDEAMVEHMSAKIVIAELREMQPGDELYDAKVTVLGEYIRHHVKEEQDEMFPKARKARLDLKQLGDELSSRKQKMMGELGVGQEVEAKAGKAARRPRVA